MRPLRIEGFYAICDLPGEAGPEEARQLATKLLRGGASVLQLRQKDASSRRLLANASLLVDLCRGAGVPFIVNDRVDVAVLVAADGVHLGQEDLPLRAVRSLAPTLAVGVSTHTLEQAEEALREGADYIGFGPVFPTSTKKRPDPVVGLEKLAEVCQRVSVPVVAIGGITAANAARVMEAGAAAVAVIGDVVRADDPEGAARRVAQAALQGRGPR